MECLNKQPSREHGVMMRTLKLNEVECLSEPVKNSPSGRLRLLPLFDGLLHFVKISSAVLCHTKRVHTSYRPCLLYDQIANKEFLR